MNVWSDLAGWPRSACLVAKLLQQFQTKRFRPAIAMQQQQKMMPPNSTNIIFEAKLGNKLLVCEFLQPLLRSSSLKAAD